MVATWLFRLLRRLAPREDGGWLFLAGLTMVLLPAFAVSEYEWVRGLALPLALALMLGYLASVALTRPAGGPGGRLAALLLLGVGLLVVSLITGWRDAPPPPDQLRWYWQPLARAGLAVQETWLRLARWGSGALAGRSGREDLAFTWLAALAGWLAAAWAGWWIFRRKRALAGLLPLGSLLTIHLFYAWVGRGWLPAFLAGAVFVMALQHHYELEEKWQRLGMDYSPEIGLDTTLVALVIAAAVFGLSATMPRVVIKPTATWFARLVNEPVARIEDAGKALFPGLRGASRSLLATGGSPGSLPRAFLLGSGPDLGEQPVLRVRTADLEDWIPADPAPEPHYWRALTYDTYDGRGWRNGPTEAQPFAAGQPWTEQTSALRRPLKQSVEVLRAGDLALYAAGEPLAPNRPYEARLRSGSDAPAADLVALLADARRYEVLSLVPAAGEDDLRAAGAAYPPGLARRYLALPPIPDRVGDLAVELTTGLATPYDQALVLQTYLRGFRYDLQVEAPPPGRDVADYFLFDLQAGYCDYYATAMVVMARSLGIPARLAVGYATGELDADERVYRVAEDSAHSWPELYFPGAGWLPFEPTAARPLFQRHGLPAAVTARGPAAATPDGIAAQLQGFAEDAIIRRRLRWMVGMPLALLLAGLSFWLWRRRPEPALPELYERLGRRGRSLGRSPGPGETAREFGRGLGDQLQALDNDRSHLAARGVSDFVGHFEAAQYSGEVEAPARSARRIWTWLGPLLRRVRLRRMLTPRRRDRDGED